MKPSFCGIPLPRLVYASPQTWEEFDRLELPEHLHEWEADPTETLLRGDWRQWERRCHSKHLGEVDGAGVTVIFQWFEYRVAQGDTHPREEPRA